MNPPPSAPAGAGTAGRGGAVDARRAALQLFVRRFAVDGLFVDAGDRRCGDDGLALVGRDRPDAACRRQDVRGARPCPGGLSRPGTTPRPRPRPTFLDGVSVSNLGFGRIVGRGCLTAFWSRGVKARSACCTRLPSWPSTVSGTSSGFCVTKNTPTPLERMRRTTCSIFSSSGFGASVNKRCASSKKKTSFGLSGSPTSGSRSYSSDSSHSSSVE